MIRLFSGPRTAAAVLLLALSTMGSAALAQTCAQRGDLDARYCDANQDLVADTPTDKKLQKDPATLVFSYTPVEDPAVYENVFGEFIAHLSKVTGKRVKWYAAESYAAQVEAIRSGRLHIAGVASGPTPYAVNLSGFAPLVAMEKFDGTTGYTLQLITHKDSPIKSVADLKGKRVAHVSPSSNSGDTAPRVLFAALGVKPGTDYEVLFSGKHDNSIMGVVNKDYDAAPVASNVVDRMRERGMFKKDDLRIVYESRPFPRTAFGVAHDLTPELQAKIARPSPASTSRPRRWARSSRTPRASSASTTSATGPTSAPSRKATGVTYTADGLAKLKRE
jgi:phosphonate transport system substrate-binding protein